MSVLIKGMEMPTNCYVCPFCDYVSARCDAVKGTPYTPPNRYEATAEWCPLIELPPHGDLIERQAVLNTFSIHMNRTRHFVTIRDTVPTIIPADKEG